MSQTETHTPTRCNLIGLSMTARRLCYRPAVFFYHFFSHYIFILARKKFGALTKKYYFIL